MPDPPLTSFGEQQCRDLNARFPYHDSVDLLVSSPLRRTIQTTLLSFTPEIARGVKNFALPEIQETSDLPCDTGSNLSNLKRDFGDEPVDLSLVPEDWDSKKGKWAAEQNAIEARCLDARKWLKSRNESHIVVVSHGGLLHYITEDWTASEKFQGRKWSFLKRVTKKFYPDAYYYYFIGTGWENTEFRSYRFVDEDGGNASLVETEESRTRRNDESKPLTKAEKTQLRETATKNWEAQGYEKASKV
ncbi:MAG: hypothetical protein LQ346_003017 [Caloplaca aetnensis]|nr:MAG: hypothetical protein LQ346_003017 [Caloplaca aetnensis]